LKLLDLLLLVSHSVPANRSSSTRRWRRTRRPTWWSDDCPTYTLF